MAGILVCLIALVAAVFWYLGATEPRQGLRNAAFYLVLVDLVIIGLVISNYVAGGKP